MLEAAHVGFGDTLYDLGCGEGEIVIAAARRGARGVGVDIDPERIVNARRNAALAGVTDRVTFIEQDLFQTDVSPASVVTLYLGPDVNRRLRPKLLSELRPGARIVSHDFSMGDWAARADHPGAAGAGPRRIPVAGAAAMTTDARDRHLARDPVMRRLIKRHGPVRHRRPALVAVRGADAGHRAPAAQRPGRADDPGPLRGALRRRALPDAGAGAGHASGAPARGGLLARQGARHQGHRASRAGGHGADAAGRGGPGRRGHRRAPRADPRRRAGGPSRCS